MKSKKKIMDGILEIPEQEIIFELNNVKINQFRIIGSNPNENSPMILDRFPISEPITLITSNMPIELRNSIVELISKYCNH